MARRFRLDDRLPASEQVLLRERFIAAGWEETVAGDWDLDWMAGPREVGELRRLQPGRRVSHIPGITPLLYKDELHHFLAVANAEAGQHGRADRREIVPDTYSMPAGFDALQRAAAGEPGAMWIAKPKRGSKGTDIELLPNAAAAPRTEPWIVQRYIANPLLLPGRPYKHVLRTYVLIESLDPLVAWLYPDGPVKFASRSYDASPSARSDRFVHLTNPPVQRLNTAVPDPIRAVAIRDYLELLGAAGIDGAAVWDRIRVVLARTLLAHRAPMLLLTRRLTPCVECCFELVGCDILVDDRCRPWLLEVNGAPSLGVSAPPDSPAHAVQLGTKSAMVADLVDLIGAGRPGRWEKLLPAARE